MPLADTAQLTAVIIGTDALLAARPATAIQLARASMRAGYDFVAPVSWGEELLATQVIDQVRRTAVPASVIVNCPFVAEALRSETAALPTCWRSVSPPVATARYLRSAFNPHSLHITYAGRCPGATAPDIDACVLPDVFLGHLLEAGFAPEDQPRYFEEMVPPDRARYSSLPGGIPEPAALRLHGGARLREAAPATVGTVALSFESPEPVVIDLESACGCICARDRFAAAQLEPPRASAPVVSAEVIVDLAPHREERLAAAPFLTRPVEVPVERAPVAEEARAERAEEIRVPMERPEPAFEAPVDLPGQSSEGRVFSQASAPVSMEPDEEVSQGPAETDAYAWAGEYEETETSVSETVEWFVESRAPTNEPANAGPGRPAQHAEASQTPDIPAFPDFAEFEAAWSQLTAGMAEAGRAEPAVTAGNRGLLTERADVERALAVSSEADPAGSESGGASKSPVDPALTVSIEPWIAPLRARPVVTPIGALTRVNDAPPPAPSFADSEVPRVPLRADMGEEPHAQDESGVGEGEGEPLGAVSAAGESAAVDESSQPAVDAPPAVERPRIVSRTESSPTAPSIVAALVTAPEVEGAPGEVVSTAARSETPEPRLLPRWTPEHAVEGNLDRIAEATPDRAEATFRRATAGTAERAAPSARGPRGTPVYAPLRAALGAMEHEEQRARRATYLRRALMIVGITVLVLVGSVFAASFLSSRRGDASSSARLEPPRLAPARVAPAMLDTLARPDTGSAAGAIPRDTSGS
jgi:hypothetical protein